MKQNLLLLIGLSICGCGEQGDRREEIAYLGTIMPQSLVKVSNLDISSRNNVAVLGDGESQYLGLRLLPNQAKLHGGIRSEVSVDFPFNEGDRVNYRWRFMIPDDFVSDTPNNRWWVIGQWHDQPDPKVGESWEDFDSLSPPISLGIGEVDGRLLVGLTYGLTTEGNIQQTTEPTPLATGTWHTIETQVHWSQGNLGQAKVFINGSADPTFIANGPNMNNAYQHYLKFGMYRHPDIATDNWIYIDDLEVVNHKTP